MQRRRNFKSSVDKFYDQEDLTNWAKTTGAKPGDMIFVLSGPANKTRAQLSALANGIGYTFRIKKSSMNLHHYG